MSMEDYTKSLQEIQIRKGKKKESLDKLEMKQYWKIVGKIMWLAENVRPDLCYGALQLSLKIKEATIRDMKKANAMIKKAKHDKSLVFFKRLSNEDFVVYAIGDASYSPGQKAVGGQFVLLGNDTSKESVPLFWKSKLIKQVCHSPKDAETRNLMRTVDITRFIADQLTQIFFGDKRTEKRIKLKVYTDSKATLDSLSLTRQIEQRMLRSVIADLKQKLETKEVASFVWITDEFMIADILTKEKKSKA